MRNKILSRVKSGFLAKFLPATLILAAAPAMVAQSSPIVFTGLETYNWGTGGAGYGSAIGLATDSAGNVYVSEPGQTRIRKVTPDGTRSVYLQTRLQAAQRYGRRFNQQPLVRRQPACERQQGYDDHQAPIGRIG